MTGGSAALAGRMRNGEAPPLVLPRFRSPVVFGALALVGRAVKPSAAEIARNPRARSAVMRVALRTSHPLPADWPRGYAEAAA